MTILEWWPVIASAATVIGGLIVWGIRLEGLSKMNKKEIEHTNDRIDQINNSLDKRLTVIDTRLETIGSTLERIIWRLPARNDTNDDQSNRS